MPDGRDFEAKCAELLKSYGFSRVERRGGSGDKGIDIVAELPMRDPFATAAPEIVASRQPEIWAVECKDWPNRTISRQKLWGQTAAVNDLGADVFLLLTTGRLSPDAKDHVRTHNRGRRGFRIIYVEAEQLDLLFREAAIPLSRADVVPGGTSVSAIQQAWHAQRAAKASIDAVHSLLRAPITPRLRVAYLEQAHRITYLPNGQTHTELALWAVNLSDSPLQEDVVRFQGDLPLVPEQLALKASQIIRRRRTIQLEPEVRLNTGNHLLVAVPFAEVARPLEPVRYTVSVVWPFTLPLNQLRYYGMPTFRLTKRHVFSIAVPGAAAPTDGWLIHDVDGAWTRLSTVGFERVADSWVARGIVRRPLLDDRHVVAFTLT